MPALSSRFGFFSHMHKTRRRAGTGVIWLADFGGYILVQEAADFVARSWAVSIIKGHPLGVALAPQRGL